jgi:hypothetical protein
MSPNFIKKQVSSSELPAMGIGRDQPVGSAEVKHVRRFWRGEGDLRVLYMLMFLLVQHLRISCHSALTAYRTPALELSARRRRSPPPPPYSRCAAAVANAITITMEVDDITPTQPATAAQGRLPPSKKGGAWLLWSNEELTALIVQGYCISFDSVGVCQTVEKNAGRMKVAFIENARGRVHP